MKSIMVLIFVAFMLGSVTGCDSSLEIVGMEIEKYPDSIVYYVGIDSELDFTGGIVSYILKGNAKSSAEMSDRYITVSHQIDFDKPGVYVVELKRHTAICRFPIQVINKE